MSLRISDYASSSSKGNKGNNVLLTAQSARLWLAFLGLSASTLFAADIQCNQAGMERHEEIICEHAILNYQYEEIYKQQQDPVHDLGIVVLDEGSVLFRVALDVGFQEQQRQMRGINRFSIPSRRSTTPRTYGPTMTSNSISSPSALVAASTR